MTLQIIRDGQAVDPQEVALCFRQFHIDESGCSTSSIEIPTIEADRFIAEAAKNGFTVVNAD